MKSGDVVICLDGSKRNGLDYYMFQNWIIEGHKYTIRRIESNRLVGERVLLDEIRNKPVYFHDLFGKAEPAFNKGRFKLHSQYIEEVNEAWESQKNKDEYLREIEI